MTDEKDPERWMRRSVLIAAVWQAARAPLCWTLAALLTVGEAVGSFYGHAIDPQIVVLIGGLFGLPFFFVGRNGNGGGPTQP